MKIGFLSVDLYINICYLLYFTSAHAAPSQPRRLSTFEPVTKGGLWYGGASTGKGVSPPEEVEVCYKEDPWDARDCHEELNCEAFGEFGLATQQFREYLKTRGAGGTPRPSRALAHHLEEEELMLGESLFIKVKLLNINL